MNIRLPWTIRKAPPSLPIATALIFLCISLFKILGPGYLCYNPWEGANQGMALLELLLAGLFWRERGRHFGGLLGCAAMFGAGAVLTWAHVTGRDVRHCGCFGPFEAPFAVHLAVTGILFTLCFLILIAEDYSEPKSQLPPPRPPH